MKDSAYLSIVTLLTRAVVDDIFVLGDRFDSSAIDILVAHDFGFLGIVPYLRRNRILTRSSPNMPLPAIVAMNAPNPAKDTYAGYDSPNSPVSNFSD
jgi:hypothetical protein